MMRELTIEADWASRWAILLGPAGKRSITRRSDRQPPGPKRRFICGDGG